MQSNITEDNLYAMSEQCEPNRNADSTSTREGGSSEVKTMNPLFGKTLRQSTHTIPKRPPIPARMRSSSINHDLQL